MQPDRIKIGAGVILHSLCGLAADWGIKVTGVEKLLAHFDIPVIVMPGGEKRYCSLYALEAALFDAGLPEVFRGHTDTVRVVHELAGLLYGHVTRQVIVDRCRGLAKILRETKISAPKKKPPKLHLERGRD